MKTLEKLTLGSVLLMAGLSAQAQEEFPVLPVEMFACNYVGGSDISDLNRSFDEFNSWADEHGINDLTMFLLTPAFYSDEFEYDVLGLNIWGSGAAFGSGNAEIASDPDTLASFDGVVECAAHSMYALVGVKPPAQDVQSGGLFEFTNCTMKGNRSENEGIATLAAVTQIYNQWNLNDAHAAFFNIAGLPSDVGYQFKWVTYYPSYETLGSLFDHFVNDGAVQTVGAILDPVMQCDSSRIYGTSVMRMGNTG